MAENRATSSGSILGAAAAEATKLMLLGQVCPRLPICAQTKYVLTAAVGAITASRGAL
jgi:hypothetical protein